MNQDKERQSGYVLVSFALILVLLLAFAALAIDVGVMYGARTSAQKAADAGALAGAYMFNLAPTGAEEAEIQGEAEEAARNAATVNAILGQSIIDSEVNVSFPPGTTRLIEVDVINHVIPTFFAGVLGWKSVSIGAKALAQSSTIPTAVPCPKPWFIPNGMFAKAVDPNDTTGCNTCDNGGANLLITPAMTIGTSVLSYIYQEGTGSCPGQVYGPVTIKPKSPNDALAPSNYFEVRLSNDDNGGAQYRNNISTCAPPVKCGDFYGLLPGNRIGPTGQGTADFIGSNTDTWYGFTSQGECVDSGGLPTFNNVNGPHSSTRMVLAPVWDICSTICKSGMKLSGSTVQIQVKGFAVMVLTGLQGNDVQAYIIDVKICKAIPPGNPPPSPLALPLQLVSYP